MADGIRIDSLEIQANFDSSGIRAHFTKGGLQSLATFRGEDDVVPEAAGRAQGVYIADIRDVALYVHIAGMGSGAQSNREAFASAYASLLAVMQPTTLVTLTVYPPNFGLGTGAVATLGSVRPMRIIGPDPSDLWYEGWSGTLELTCIASPPDWAVVGS